MDADSQVPSYLDDHAGELIERLSEWIRMPSVGLYGRGSSDAKGQVMAHIWGIRAHLNATGRSAPAVNLKFLVEGEEEAGSPGLRDLLEAKRSRLDAEAVIFSDTLLWRADHPALCTSIRGMLGARIEVHGQFTDIHSGAVSGTAPQPRPRAQQAARAAARPAGQNHLPRLLRQRRRNLPSPPGRTGGSSLRSQRLVGTLAYAQHRRRGGLLRPRTALGASGA